MFQVLPWIYRRALGGVPINVLMPPIVAASNGQHGADCERIRAIIGDLFGHSSRSAADGID